MKIADISDTGNDLETLKALRHKVATAIDRTESGRDIAALSRQLQLVMAQISELEEQRLNDDSALDEIIKHKRQVRGLRGSALLDEYDE